MPALIPLDPATLPDIATLRKRAKALAMLDAIVSPEWEYRYFSYNASWFDGEEMASMRNGSGDEWFVHFGPFGAAIKGIAHESPLAGDSRLVEAVQQQVPPAFAAFLNEAAFSMDWLSYCYWRSPDDAAWQKVAAPNVTTDHLDDGSVEFLALLIEPASGYVEFAQWYYEQAVPLAAVQQLYDHTPLTADLVAALNPELDFAEAVASAVETGYPCAR
ncbi:MAG: hypothetical protein ABS977_21960 [Pseudomonas qingdaonensis]|uniref:hypothetical protein n=1 Tax=Pseudomonas qingdaonensis TaxID=2056231 RepID=UPI0033146105